jgi:RNA polymerase sigma-70 factor (ECF subfamily)
MSDAGVPSPASPDALTTEALKKYRAVLHGYVLRRLRHRPQDTADLTQEIFERFLRKKDRAEMIRNPLAYLYGIASHVVAETLEQEPQQLVTFNSTLADQVADSPLSADSADMARQLGMRADIVQALRKLPQAHLTALLLVEGDGLSCKEAARISGYSTNTIKQYLSTARATLKRLLEDYWSPGRLK